MAHRQDLPTGVVVSRLLRAAGGPTRGREPESRRRLRQARRRSGLFPARDTPVDDEHVDRLRDEAGV
ncbi:MAG: hypothetical protein U5K43_10125 [Halofilum sp. (in: g-proteobacteria)]|nr:hypothetical protein [Halofilum sp. (in: g-proteobacteria)]